jgi:hypothetical protein
MDDGAGCGVLGCAGVAQQGWWEVDTHGQHDLVHIPGDDELASRGVDHDERQGPGQDKRRLLQSCWRLLVDEWRGLHH